MWISMDRLDKHGNPYKELFENISELGEFNHLTIGIGMNGNILYLGHRAIGTPSRVTHLNFEENKFCGSSYYLKDGESETHVSNEALTRATKMLVSIWIDPHYHEKYVKPILTDKSKHVVRNLEACIESLRLASD